MNVATNKITKQITKLKQNQFYYKKKVKTKTIPKKITWMEMRWNHNWKNIYIYSKYS